MIDERTPTMWKMLCRILRGWCPPCEGKAAEMLIAKAAERWRQGCDSYDLIVGIILNHLIEKDDGAVPCLTDFANGQIAIWLDQEGVGAFE